MNHRTMLAPILQAIIPKKEIQPLLQQAQYVDTARKFTVYALFTFLAEAALRQWDDDYRDGEKRMVACGLPQADHSIISKKAKEVPFGIFKQLLHVLIQKCNRPTHKPSALLLAVDSTTISAGLNCTIGQRRKEWHYAARGFVDRDRQASSCMESPGKQHDSTMCTAVTDPNFILIADRAFGNHKQFDAYMEQEQVQYFVIRVKKNTVLWEPVYRQRKRPYIQTIEQDMICRLGKQKLLLRYSKWVSQLRFYMERRA